jgi:hypothetical protein
MFRSTYLCTYVTYVGVYACITYLLTYFDGLFQFISYDSFERLNFFSKSNFFCLLLR